MAHIYWWKSHKKGDSILSEHEETYADIDDMIYDEEDGGPSER